MALIDAPVAMRSHILNSVLDGIGNTPLIRINKLAAGLKVKVAAKVEFMNPGGSVKDRIGPAMIDDAERQGTLKPGGTIVEATSGNTGVGLAIAAAVKGYKTIFVMPDKMSDEKIRLLRAFGARVVITPTAVEPDDPRSYYSVARRIAAETPNAILAGQYWNPANPEAHYRSTGPEIWQQSGGQVDVFVAGMGTGGTISGVSRFLKEQNPHVVTVGVDPLGSLYTEYFRTGALGAVHGYKVEGVGEDFIPTTIDFKLIDDVVQVNDREAFLMTRRLTREEGLFVGGSCGMAMAGALKWVRGHDLPEGATVVVLLPDSGSRYLSKIFSDDWMRENGFLESGQVADLLEHRTRTLVLGQREDTIADVIGRMKGNNISQMPVVDDQGVLCGLISEIDLLNYLLSGAGAMDHTIRDITAPEVRTVRVDTTIDALSDIAASTSVAVVVDDDNRPTGIITKIDMIDYLANHTR
ncbi:MAG: cystathionine beta-synthase [Herpetosiphon sp.]